jgi:2-oxoglutarate dehydrogenase E1 component
LILNALQQGGVRSVGVDMTQAQADGQKLMQYIRAFMTHGHLKADIDPLKLDSSGDAILNYKYKKVGSGGLLDIENYGFTEADLQKKFFVSLPYWGGLLSKKPEWTLQEIRTAFEGAYCGKIGIEYMHIPSRDQCNWIREKIELRQFEEMSKQDKLLLLDRLFWTDEFS